jgi:hypothetical protein
MARTDKKKTIAADLLLTVQQNLFLLLPCNAAHMIGIRNLIELFAGFTRGYGWKQP